MSSYGQSDVYIPAPDARTDGGGKSLQRIFVPVDSSGQSGPALAAAARFSAEVGGQVRLVHVRMWDPVPRSGGARFYTETSHQATAVLERALTSVWAYGVPASGVIVDAARSRVARVIAAEARSWGAQVMVITRRSRTALGALLLGSLSNQLMREADCPVLVTRQGRR